MKQLFDNNFSFIIMNSIQILALSKQFLKFAKPDPFRNMEHDIEEAIDYCSFNYIEMNDGKSLDEIPTECFSIFKMEQFPTKNLYKYDDVDSWLDVKPGELKRKSKNELSIFLKNLRNNYAISWIRDGIPAIILVDFGKYAFIGDGRGRINFAIGMGFQTVPVVILTLKPEFEDQIVFKE